jgi:hypothetical protein
MFFDENILKILYKLPQDEDIQEAVDQYLLSCLQSASEALIVYVKKGPQTSDWAELSESLKLELQSDTPSLEVAFQYLNKLLELDSDFKEVYDGYIEEINESIINKASERDETVLDDLNIYLETKRDASISDYIKVFVDNFPEEEPEAATQPQA